MNQLHERRELRAIALVLGAALCFASLSVIVLLALRTGTELLVVLQWRFGLAAFVLLMIVRERAMLPARRWMPLVVIGMIGQFAVTFVNLSALNFIRPAALTFLFFTYPAWVVAGAAMFGWAPLDRRRALAIGLALTGVAIMLRPGSQDLLDPRGVALGLAAALLYAAYLPTLSKVQTGVPPLVAAFYVILGATISYAIASLLFAEQQLPASVQAWQLIGVLAIISTVVPFGLLIAGVSVLGAVKTSIAGTAEPFFTSLLAVLLLGDALRPATIGGGALIAAAVVLNARAMPRPRIAEPPAAAH